MNYIKILCFAPSLNVTSGITNHIINYYRNINHNKYKIDFLLMDDKDKTYYKEIEKNGGKIYIIKKPKIMQLPSYILKIKKFFKNNSKKYDILHSHNYNYGSIILYFAKKFNIKERILHIHVTKYSDKKIKSLINYIIVIISKKYSNVYFACSEEVGKFAFRNKKYYVINNALDINNFKYDENIRKKVRQNEKIFDNTVVIGNVGRFKEQKNHTFLLEIYKEYLKINSNSKLILIGNGPLKNKIINKANNLGILKNIIFKENITNVNEYYQAMDLFILPSIYEGLGIVLIEAQISGLPCFCSDNLPKKVFLSKLCKGISLKESAKNWAKIINQSDFRRKDVIRDIEKQGFSIYREEKKLEKIYTELNER